MEKKCFCREGFPFFFSSFRQKYVLRNKLTNKKKKLFKRKKLKVRRLGLNSHHPLSSSNDLTTTATTIMTSSCANLIISQSNLHWAKRPFINPFFRNTNHHIFDITFKSSMCDLHSFSPSFFFFLKKQNTHQCQTH